jgi:hypothetical protein
MRAPAERAVAEVRLWTHVFYGATALWAALIFLKIPAVALNWDPLHRRFYYSMLLMAVSTFPVSHWVGMRFLTREGLQDPAQAFHRVRTGVLILAAMGEACAVYGYAVYFVTGHRGWPWLFFFFAAAHYALTIRRLEGLSTD